MSEHLQAVTSYLQRYNAAVGIGAHPPSTSSLTHSEAARVERFLSRADPLALAYRQPGAPRQPARREIRPPAAQAAPAPTVEVAGSALGDHNAGALREHLARLTDSQLTPPNEGEQ